MPTAQDIIDALIQEKAKSQEAPLPWNQPQSPIFSMFGVVGGNAQEEAARAAAEKAYDYAMAEAEKTARLANPRFGGMDTEEALNAELFAPLTERWNPTPRNIRIEKAEGPRTWHVGNALIQETDKGPKVVYQETAKTVPEKPSITVETVDANGNKLQRKMTQAEFAEYQKTASTIPDADTEKLVQEYAFLKSKIGAGDTAWGPDWLGLTDRRRRLAELETILQQKGVLPKQEAPPMTTAPSAGVRKIIVDKNGNLGFSQ